MRPGILVRRMALWMLLLGLLWLGGLYGFIGLIPAQPSKDERQADAIVVLTGGAGRLDYGLQLLSEGKAKALFISGVYDNSSFDALLQNVRPDMRRYAYKAGQKVITIGREADNTVGNAEETAAWLREHHYTAIRLVTANYHMPRSLEEFSDIAPEITLIPSPSFPENFDLAHWWQSSDSRFLVMSEYHKYLASKLRHWYVTAFHRPRTSS